MTGFGSLYYTDCVPGQGLQGGAGFQFQAATPGPATDAMHVVQRSALYEPPAAWMRDRRPVADYPRSLAHIAEEGFLATAAGCYRGQEANGTRQGNQFTHAVVTRDPAAYGLVRPAQLWAADWWAQAAAAGTALPELPPDPAPGPLDVETVRDRVAAAPAADALLTALVSALEHLADPQRRRTVVLVGEDPERAACWLAAATLLLPSPHALRVSFKIFVTDPQYARHQVVALHPEWAGRWADTQADSGLAVLDLDRGRCSTVETTPAAAFWVPRFLRVDDPYDVVDAVEMAGQFAATRPERGPDDRVPGPSTADRLVAVVAAGRERLDTPDEVSAVAEWLRTAPAAALEIARDDALKAVLVTEPPAGVLRTLAAAVSGGRWEPAAVHHVLDGLLRAELTEVVDAADGLAALRAARGHEPLRVVDRAGQDRTAAAREVNHALRASAPERVPALLTVARRHDVTPQPTEFATTAEDFARWWLRQTDDELGPRRWDAPDHALDWVRGVLRADLTGAAGDRADRAVATVRDRWWEPLAAAVHDPGDRLDRLVWSATYLHLEDDPAAATAVRRTVLDACRQRFPAPEAGTQAWGILTRFTGLAPSECVEFLQELEHRGLPLPSTVATALERTVSAQSRLGPDGLHLVHELHRHGHPLVEELDRQRVRDLEVSAIVDDLVAKKPGRKSKDVAAALNQVTPSILALRLGKIVDALVRAPVERAAAVLCVTGPARFRDLVNELMNRWPRTGASVTPAQARAAALVFVVTSRPRDDKQKIDFDVPRNRLAQCVTTLDKEGQSAVFRALPPTVVDDWARWLKGHEPNRFKRGLNRMTGGVLGESGRGKG